MPYYTENYIDAEDNRRYIFFSQATIDLQNIYDSIVRLKVTFYTPDGAFATSLNEGECVDTYEKNTTKLTGLLRPILSEYGTFLTELSARINTAQGLAIKYEQSRNRTREVYYPGT